MISNPTPGLRLEKNENANLKRFMYPNVHTNTIYNSQGMEATWLFIDRWMNKDDMVYKCLSGGSVVKNLPAMQERKGMQVWTLDGEDPLEEGMATHSSILA